MTTDFRVVAYRPDDRARWDEFVHRSKNGNFLFQRAYMDYHSDRFEDRSVLVEAGSRVLAVFPCNRVGDVLASHGGLTYGGLLTGVEVHAADVLRVFEALRDHFVADGVGKVIYKAIPHVFHRYPAEEDLYALRRMGATLVRRDLSSVIDLASRPPLSDSRKNTARKAAKAGASVRELVSMQEFHALQTSVLARFGLTPVHSLEEMILLRSRFPAQIRLFGMVLGDELLAGTLVYDFGHVVHTQYMASSDRGRQVGALDGLLVHLLCETFADKRFLSFGVSTENGGTYLNEGLSRQKEGFGGRGIVHDCYEWML